jgi:hypothetical protein
MKFLIKNLTLLLLSITLFTINTNSAFSQTNLSDLFTTLSKDDANVPAEQRIFFEKSAQDENTVYQQIVKLRDVNRLFEDERVSFVFPSISEVLIAEKHYVELFPDGGFAWNGVFPDDNGDITIFSKNGAHFGGITYKDEYFSLEDLGNGLTLIRKVATPKDGENAFEKSRKELPFIPDEDASMLPCNIDYDREIDVLYLFADNAGTQKQMDQKATETTTDMNLVATNSKINVHFNNVGVKPYPFPKFASPANPKGFEKEELGSAIDNAAEKSDC